MKAQRTRKARLRNRHMASSSNRRKPSLQPIGDMLVDLDGIRRIRHHCDPELCKGTRNCCRYYAITFTYRELRRAVGLMPYCRELAPHLAEGQPLENPFEHTGPGEYTVDEQDNGACAFAFTDARNRTWCSIHAAALRLGLDPAEHKAVPCMLWPLALTEDEEPVLGVHDDAFQFPCNTRPRRPLKQLDPGIASCIRAAFGDAFLEQVKAAAAATPTAR